MNARPHYWRNTLDEGVAEISIRTNSGGISDADRADIIDWLELVTKQIRRGAFPPKPEPKIPDTH